MPARVAATALKVGVSAGLLYFIASSISLDVVSHRLQQVALWPAAAGIAILLVQAAMATRRWWLLLEFMGIRWKFPVAVRVFMAGLFFNQTMLSTIGGDAVRGWYVYRGNGKAGTAVANVLLDRFAGVVVLLLIATFTLPLMFGFVASPVARWGMAGILVAMSAVSLGIFYFRRPPAMLSHWRVLQGLATLSGYARQLTGNRRVLIPVLGYSLGIHLLTVTCLYSLSLASDLPVTFQSLLVIVPPVLLVSMLPISVAGWGVREGAMVVGLGFVGVSAEQALTLSILFGLTMLVVGLFGGVMWVMHRN